MDKVAVLTKMYQEMSEEQRQIEIDSIFEIMFAMLEACECDAMETFPNVNIKLSFRCDVLKDANQNYLC